MIGFEFAAQPTQVGGLRGLALGGRCHRRLALPGDAVQPALRAATASEEPQRTVGPNRAVGDVERSATDKTLLATLVTGAFFLQMHGEDATVGPVADEQRLFIARGETRAVAKEHGGRRSQTDVDDTRQGVGLPGGESTRAATPAEVGAGDQVQHAVGHVPGRPDIALHVGVEGEEFAVAVEGEVERIAQAAGVNPQVVAIGTDAQDVAGRHLDGAIEHAAVPGIRQHLIPGAVFQRRGRRERTGQQDVVAAGEPEMAIRA